MTAALFALGVTQPNTSYGKVVAWPNTGPQIPHNCRHPITAKASQSFIERVWDQDRWRRGKPKHSTIAAFRRKLHCAGPANRKALKHRWREAQRAFYLHSAYRQIAPFRGFDGEGYWLRWLPIPRYIVECETSGFSGEGRWLAANPSGANGPAQLLGHGQPYPAQTDAERLTYWRIARDLYIGAGSSPWACA